jgi:hypothetical protein
MERNVIFRDRQEVQAGDLLNIGSFGRDSLDHVVNDGITSDLKYTGFSVTAASGTEVDIATGRLFDGGKVYVREAVHSIDFLGSLPLSTEKIIAIVAYGATQETDLQPRDFLTNVDSGATEPSSVAMESLRYAQIGTSAGTEAATPAKPTIPSTQLVIAWVTLDTGGIKSIEQNTDGLLPSVKSNAARLTSVETWRDTVGNRLDTLASDIAGLADSAADTADNSMIESVAADVARVKELLELEDSYTDYGADRFLDTGESDTDNVNFLAKVEEGVRFSNDAEDEFALQLFNPIDPTVMTSGNVLLPKYSHKRRLTVDGYQQQLSISQYAFQTVSYVKKYMSRQRIRYGESKTVCTNSRWWRGGTYNSATGVLRVGNETWQVTNTNHHKWKRVRKFWYDTYTVPYWDKIITDHTVNGSVVAQTFLNSQVGWMTQLHLYFQSVGPSGDVTVLLCETEAGKPNPNKVIGDVTFSHGDMVVGWNAVAFPATLLEPGKRYGLVLITGGNHYVGLANGSRYAQGTLFYSTDGEYYQGDLTKDLMFAIDCAEFEANRIEVEMDALSLSGGISDIDLMAQMAVPDGASLTFEIQPGGSGAWSPLDEVVSGNTVLYGLPALCKFRAVFTGTPDSHAGINLVTSRMNISRPRTTFEHLSEAVTFAGTTQSLKITVLLENYKEANHDLTCVIDDVTNASNDIAPATTTDVDLGVDENGDSADHKRIKRTFEWTATELASATGEIVIKLSGTTSSALDVFHVSERVHLAF